MNLNEIKEMPDTVAISASRRILEGLNPEQRAVALHGEGPLLVLAVAGSGKTRAIAHRAVYLISAQGVSASHILCLTFTNKATEEMRERIGGLLGGHTGGVTVSTFHALCARLLRIHHSLIQRSSRFVIYDEEDSRRLIMEVAKELGAEGTWEQIRSDMDRLKNRGILPHEDMASALGHAAPDGPYLKQLKVAYRLYEDRLTRYDAVDFPGLLHKTTRMLEERPEVLDRMRQRYRYILVDEYQDTCPLQEWLLRLLSAPSYNLCAVGDDDQAIYAFRHADVRGILTFEARYAGAKVIRMEQNYRSAGSIIEVARQVISANTLRKHKAIYTANAHGTPVQVSGFSSEEEEAAWIRNTVQEMHTRGVPYGGMAILCRVASLFRSIERELAGALIPYTLVDGLAFWERREVRDVMAYLRFIHNPKDYLSFKRIANVPPRGLGKKTLKGIEERLSAHPSLTLMEILDEASRRSDKLKPFLSLMESLRKESGSVSGLIQAVLGRVEYEAYLVKTFPDAMRRVSHLIQLSAMARRFEQEQCSDLSEFLLQSGLAASGEEEEGGPPQSIRLMTIHAAKGLEFQAVFVVGLEEGILPHARCMDNLEEERRLFYVAVTRAKERLFLTWSTRRMIHGREMHHRLSPFVKEILRPDGWIGGKSPVKNDRYPVIISPAPHFQKDKVATR